MDALQTTHRLEETARFSGILEASDPSGRFQALIDAEGTLTVVDTAPMAPTEHARFEVGVGFQAAAVAPDGMSVAGFFAGRLLRFPATDAAPSVSSPAGAWFTADGQHLLVVDANEGTLEAFLYDAKTFALVHKHEVLGFDSGSGEMVPVSNSETLVLHTDVRVPNRILGHASAGDSLGVIFELRVHNGRIGAHESKAIGEAVLDLTHEFLHGLQFSASGLLAFLGYDGCICRLPWPPDGEEAATFAYLETLLELDPEDIPFEVSEDEDMHVEQAVCDGQQLIATLNVEDTSVALLVLEPEELSLRGIVPLPGDEEDDEPSPYTLLNTGLIVRDGEDASVFFRIHSL